MELQWMESQWMDLFLMNLQRLCHLKQNVALSPMPQPELALVLPLSARCQARALLKMRYAEY